MKLPEPTLRNRIILSCVAIIIIFLISAIQIVSADKEYPRADDQIYEGAPNANYGAGTIDSIQSQLNGNAYIIMNYNLSNISYASFGKVNISEYTGNVIRSNGTSTLAWVVYFCTDGYFNETNISWKNFHNNTWVYNSCNFSDRIINISILSLLNNTRQTFAPESDKLAQRINNDADKSFTLVHILEPVNQSTIAQYIEFDSKNNANILLRPYLEFVVGDYQKPIINFTYPINNTRMNDFNGSILFFANETVNCSINNTNFILTSTNGTHFQYDYSGFTEGIYNLTISCSDGGGLGVSATLNFQIDTTKPQIIYYFPLNNSISNATQHLLNVSVFDNNALWIVNITIKNSTGDIKYTHTSGNISIASDIKYYNYSELIDTSGFTSTNDTFMLFIESWDAHTGELISVDIAPTEQWTIDEKIEVLTLDDTEIKIRHPTEEDFNFTVKPDRISWDIETTNTGETVIDEHLIDEPPIDDVTESPVFSYYIIDAPNSVLLPNSAYPCHIIVDDKFWMDCEGLKNPDISELNNNIYRIGYQKEDIVNVESTGILNYINQTSYFTIDKVIPIITLQYPQDATTYNKSDFQNKIIIDISKNVSCIENDTEFSLLSNNATYYHWIAGSVSLGNHSVQIQCTDNLGNTGYLNFVFEIVEPTNTGGANVTVNTSVSVDVILIMVIIIYLFLVIFSFLVKDTYLFVFTSLYGLFMGLWLWNSYPSIPKTIILVFLTFNAYIVYQITKK